MSAVFQMRRAISSDHRLSLTLPSYFPEGEVEITFRSITPVKKITTVQQSNSADLNALFSYLDKLTVQSRSKEEIDNFIANERASWD
jgi:hypothetical protein